MDLAKINNEESITLYNDRKKRSEEIYNSASQYLKNEDFDKAEELFLSLVKKDEFPNIYNCSLLSLAKIYEKKNLISKAVDIYDQIIDQEDSFSQYSLLVHLRKYTLTKKVEDLSEIELDHPLYDWAQFELGLAAFNNDKSSLSEIHNFWKNVAQDSYSYWSNKYLIDLIEKLNFLDIDITIKYFKLLKDVNAIVKKLKFDNKYENYIAHYTDLTVAKVLLSRDENSKEFKPKSALRLGVTNLMNDPEEGLLINKLLCLDSKITTQDSAFIACFTLHHDSLNQFRLYGKENKEEASGLSLVLSKEFFSLDYNISDMVKGSNIELESNEANKKDQKALTVIPLYRCIYLDPTSGLIKVAQREEWSFHREYKKKNKGSILDSNPEAEISWKQYQQEILEVESEVSKALKALVEQVKLLNPKDQSDEEKELLAEILLPLRYLIKHMAFKEEQECRIVYVTKMENPLVKYHKEINRIYIDYEPYVMAHLEKIYLAPKAKDERTFMEYLCAHGQVVRQHKVTDESNGLVQVKISKNPFR